MAGGYYTAGEASDRVHQALGLRIDRRLIKTWLDLCAQPYEDLGNRLRIPARSVDRVIDAIRAARRRQPVPTG